MNKKIIAPGLSNSGDGLPVIKLVNIAESLTVQLEE